MDFSIQQIKPGARLAVSALFVANGLVAGFWSVFVPVIQKNLGIGESAMGLLILIGASAGFVGLLLSGLLISQVGSRPVAVAAGLLLAPSLLFLTSAGSFVPAAALFVLFFLSMSVMDVAMNANGADAERALGKAVMSSFHGFWSLGAMTGAASGGFLLASAGQQGLALVSLVACAGLVIPAFPYLVAHQPGTPKAKPSLTGWRIRLPGNMRVYLFGVLALAAFTAEGSVIDWSALYLRKEMAADVELSGFAFAGFSLAMTISRFSGDSMRQRLGAVRLLQVSAGMAVAGFLCAGAGGNLPIVIGGFLLAGMGCANIVPVAFSAASNVPGVKPATGIAIATMFGYFGLLCAPAFLGATGEAYGFSPVYLGFAGAMILVMFLAQAAKNPPEPVQS